MVGDTVNLVLWSFTNIFCSDSIDCLVDRYGVQKMSLLRAFCKVNGVQLLLREYSMDNKSRQAFNEEDVVNVFPNVKHIHPKASDAYHVFTSGQAKIQQGLLREGYELISEALNLLNNVYGAMHPEIAACARLLARLNYIMGDYGEALVYQQRAVLMSERVLGIDDPNTITEYVSVEFLSLKFC
jgi:protein TIF31